MDNLHLSVEAFCRFINLQEEDKVSKKFLLLLESQGSLGVEQACLKYGYSRQRYYQLLRDFRQWGMKGLMDRKPGPKQSSLEQEDLTKWVIRYKFQDAAISPAVIAQHLRQKGYKVSERSIQQIIRAYGLQKKICTN